MMKRCLIIEAGPTPEELIERHGDYPVMIERWLAPVVPDVIFTRNRRYAGEPLPMLSDLDAVIISGSRFSVCDEEIWMLELEEYVRSLFEMDKPTFGICFGHQIIAKALGGTVEQSDQGWGLGVTRYDLNPDTSGLAGNIHARAVHQDQIVALPEQAQVLGGNEHCPFAILEYNQAPFASVQFHPEFTPEYLRDLLPVLNDRGVPSTSIEAAGEDLETACDDKAVARWAASTLFPSRGEGIAR